MATEQSTSAAAWLTVHWVECHLLYGKASGRLAGDGVAMRSASIRSGKAAAGLVDATSFIRSHSPATSARCSAMVRPSAARRALSIMAYCWTGSHSRWATSTGSSSGPGRSRSTSGVTPGWAASVGARPARSRSRTHRFASPPTTTATSDPPDRMAARASLTRLCWGIPSSTRYVVASGDPIRSATNRAGSG